MRATYLYVATQVDAMSEYFPGEIQIAVKESVKKTGANTIILRAVLNVWYLFTLTPEQVEDEFRKHMRKNNE